MFRTVLAFLLVMAAHAMAAPPHEVPGLEEAVALYDAGNHAAAENALAAILRDSPDNPAALYYMGMSIYNQGRVAEAIPYLEKIATGPNAIEGIDAFLAELYLSEGETAKAFPFYREKYRANPGDETVAYRYALCLKGKGRADDAKEILQRLADGDGETADAARYELGTILTEEGAYVSAVKRFRDVSQNSPYAGAAAAYIESLAAYTRPVSLYGSVEYFYDDNPASTSAERLDQQQTKVGGSRGTSVTAVASTRHLPLGETLDASLQYLFYGIFYNNRDASANDFYGHFIEPAIRWHAAPRLDVTLGGSACFYYLDRQEYSSSIGGSLIADWKGWRGHALKLHASYARTNYTDAYKSGGSKSTLEYMDADTWGIGAGANLTLGNATLNLDYAFNYEDTLKRSDALLGDRAADSRYREHALTSSLTLPFQGKLNRFSVIASVNYSHKDYPERQSGELYTSVAGERMEVDLLVLDARLQVALWKKANLNLAIGVERTESDSPATEFDYVRNRYLLQLTAFY